MISTKVGHIQFNIATENLPFYKELFTYLGWQTLHEGEDILGIGDGGSVSLWFLGSAKEVKNDYDGPGVNHLALSVREQGEVDQVVAYLQKRDIPALFDTPRHRPEFSLNEEYTYYQVMFETPDEILLEIVFEGKLVR